MGSFLRWTLVFRFNRCNYFKRNASFSYVFRASGDTKAGYGPRKRKERNVVFIEKIETEADRQLKELVKKQLEVKPSLDE